MGQCKQVSCYRSEAGERGSEGMQGAPERGRDWILHESLPEEGNSTAILISMS